MASRLRLRARVGGYAVRQRAEPSLDAIAKGSRAEQDDQTDGGDQQTVLHHVLTLVVANEPLHMFH